MTRIKNPPGRSPMMAPRSMALAFLGLAVDQPYLDRQWGARDGYH